MAPDPHRPRCPAAEFAGDPGTGVCDWVAEGYGLCGICVDGPDGVSLRCGLWVSLRGAGRWPWGFWVTSVVCILVFMFGVIVIPSESMVRTEDTPTFDYIGAMLGVCGLVLLNFAWNQAPLVGWSTPYVCVTLVVGSLSLAGFAWHESRVRHPLLPPEILRNGPALCTMACVALGWSSFGIWIYYTFQLMETLRGVTALDTAVQFIPEAISGMVAAVTTGYILSRVRLTYLVVFSLFAFTAGCVLSATAPVRQTYWANIFVSMVVMPWGRA